jgi:hypothetical protein
MAGCHNSPLMVIGVPFQFQVISEIGILCRSYVRLKLRCSFNSRITVSSAFIINIVLTDNTSKTNNVYNLTLALYEKGYLLFYINEIFLPKKFQVDISYYFWSCAQDKNKV